MTNPAAAIRALVTYALCIPLAMLVGWLLSNPLGYGTLGFFGIIALLLISPVIIKWHYPILVFGLGAPVMCFFLKGNPPLWQAAIILSLGMAVISRCINSDKKFITPTVIVLPLLFTVAMVYMTAQLTGGIGLKALGGDVGGGKKYLAIFIGIAGFFALTAQTIPKDQRNFYLALYFLPGVLQFFSDLFPVLPAPLNYINLLIPPSEVAANPDASMSFGGSRLAGFSTASSMAANFMLARYGLRGVFRLDQPLKLLLFIFLLLFCFIGGFRIVLIGYTQTFILLFFLEGLHRTKMLPVAILGVVLLFALLIPFANKLPYSYQRTLTVIPILKLDPGAVLDAQGSRVWREEMWADTWPKVPQYLLLGKGYALSQEDFAMIGTGQFAGAGVAMDKSLTPLAISGDYHNGPLSTLMPFGIWGGISFLWVAAATFFILFRNYRYGDDELKSFNRYFLVIAIQGIIGYFIFFGAYANVLGDFAKWTGFSIAMNWGICAAKARAVSLPRIKPLPRPRPQPVIA